MDASTTAGGAVGPAPLTFGQKAVGISFNPSNDPDVEAIKQAYAKVIDLCNDLRTKYGQGEKGRLLSVAITEAQGSQMFAVKGVTWQDESTASVAGDSATGGAA